MIKTIVISGPESSGKTWLSGKLASHFKEPLVLEFSREFLDRSDGMYEQSDLIKIAKGQFTRELEAIHKAKNIIIEDTGIIDIRVWSLIKYGDCNPALLNYNNRLESTFYILCAPNIAYEEDPYRESPKAEKREAIFKTFLSILNDQDNFLGIIDDSKENRLKKAIEMISSKIKF